MLARGAVKLGSPKQKKWLTVAACHAGRLGDNWTPVGSVRLFMKFSIINRTNVLTLGSLLSEHPHLSLSIHTRSSAMPD